MLQGEKRGRGVFIITAGKNDFLIYLIFLWRSQVALNCFVILVKKTCEIKIFLTGCESFDIPIRISAEKKECDY